MTRSIALSLAALLAVLLFAPLIWTGRIVAGVAAGIAGLLLAGAMIIAAYAGEALPEGESGTTTVISIAGAE